MQQGEMKFRDGKIVRRDEFRWFTGVKSKTPGGEHYLDLPGAENCELGLKRTKQTCHLSHGRPHGDSIDQHLVAFFDVAC